LFDGRFAQENCARWRSAFTASGLQPERCAFMSIEAGSSMWVEIDPDRNLTLRGAENATNSSDWGRDFIVLAVVADIFRDRSRDAAQDRT
jgi:hypothetical protein